MRVLGIDPGERNTAAVVREGDRVLFAATYVREDETPPFSWGLQCVHHIRDEVLGAYPDIEAIGLEGIQAPRGYSKGKLAPINPKPLIFMAIAAGSLADNLSRTHRLVIVPAKKNGAGPDDAYPSVLTGRRPKELPGHSAGSRRHEKSAYDIAGEVPLLIANNYYLDTLQVD